MKRFCWIIFIATAVIFRYEQCYINGNHISGQGQCDFTVIYEGNEIPNTYDVEHLSAVISSATLVSQYGTGLATFVRADATARGYTIPAGQVYEMQWTSF